MAIDGKILSTAKTFFKTLNKSILIIIIMSSHLLLNLPKNEINDSIDENDDGKED